MNIVIWLFFVIIVVYTILIIAFIGGFLKLKETSEPYKKDSVCFSIVIPFRNEADNLPLLLKSILRLKYISSFFEIIFVDDASSDASVQIITLFLKKNSFLDAHIIPNKRMSNSPKKDAITTAIQKTKYNWIVTTDADCVLPKYWLKSFNNYICKYHPNMIVAPVHLIGDSSFLAQFQVIDFLSMQGVTIGGFGLQLPFMANGANLAYKKNVFLQLEGFDANNNIASGDDIFLLENFIKHDEKSVHFIKNTNALVQTYVQTSWKNLIQQRKRWAAKSPHFTNNFTKLVGVLVVLVNLFVLLSFFILPFYTVFGYGLFLKFTVDSVLVFKTASFYKQPICVRQYLKTLVFYPFFTLYIAVLSLLTSFNWKGREFKK